MIAELNPQFTITKSQILKSIEQLPEDATMDDMIEKMVFMKKIEEGLRAIEDGRVVDNESVRENINSGCKNNLDRACQR